ncbi:MAG TPA: CehA/McbA family metallohydrolase [Myxococcota bacterium]|nr:CehA/McbA family metallohydrolase [Myxococcota bacterium]
MATSAVLACACSTNGPGAPLDERLGPGQVRAGVIAAESELIGGPEAQGWIGDFKLYNSRAAFIIENIDQPRAWGPYGGSLLDADIVRPVGEPGRDRLAEIFPQLGMLTLFPEQAEVIADGSDGQAAIVRISGRDQGIPELDAAIDGAIEPKDLRIVHDYILEPDVEYLRIRTSITTGARAAVALDAGDVVLNGDTTSDFVPGSNFTGSGIPSGEHDYLAGAAPDGCNLYAGASGGIQATFGLHEVALLKVVEGSAPPESGADDPLVAERILVVGAGGLDACLRILDDYKGDLDSGLLAGAVVDSSGKLQAGLSVIASREPEPAGDVIDQTYTDAEGSFEMQLPPGDYRLRVQPAGRPEISSDPVTLAAGQTVPVPLTIPEAARLAYRCSNQGGGPLPCKLSLQSGHDAAMSAPVDMDSLNFGAGGQGSFVVPVGDWTVTLSRGWEYDIHRQNVTTVAGQTIDVAGVLTRQVDTTGYVAADLHTHCTRSIDSTYDIEDKIASNLAEGVEIVVITDHDCSTDFTPYIDDLKKRLAFDLDQWLVAVTGNEVSPHFGHCTVFPMPSHPVGWIYWQVPWTFYEQGRFVRHLEFPEIWPKVRELGAKVINAAHPLSYNAWFSYMGFDPPDAMPRLDSLPTDKFSTEFDTIELLNKNDVNLMLEKVLPLWSAMNNQGVFRTAVGVSDAHQRDAEAGFGRTLVVSSSDDPKNVDLDQIWSNLKQRRALVGGGIFVSIEIAGSHPGDLLSSPGPLNVNVHVEAADWVPASKLDLIANGQTIENLELASPGVLDPAHPAVRYDGQLSVSPTVDTWYAAVAYAEKGATLDPVFRGCRPVGMTNAIQVDVDDNGRFDPVDK